jgi:hypothetical protein
VRTAAASLMVVLAVAAALALPGRVLAATTPDPHAGEPWWVPLGLAGERVTSVSVTGTAVDVIAGGRRLRSSDGGASFAPAAGGTGGASAGGAGSGPVTSGDDQWLIRGGLVLHGHAGSAPAPDPGSPDLGAGAHLLAAPRDPQGTVVAVSDAGVVWRRAADGDWSRTLVLLPRSLVGGTPDITDLTAFTTATPGGALPVTVYMATDGYAVLASQDGGGTWFRDGPGLPDGVHALAAAPALSAILAATDDGVWVHHLRALPGVPQYSAPDLTARQRAIVGITVAAAALGVGGLALALRRRPSWAR